MQESKTRISRPLPFTKLDNPSARLENATVGSAWGKVQAKTAEYPQPTRTVWMLMCSVCRTERRVVPFDKHTWQLVCACNAR